MDRNALHHLVDELPEAEVGHVAALIEAARNHDRAAIQSLLADDVNRAASASLADSGGTDPGASAAPRRRSTEKN